jgi:hypothetical protein
VSSIGKSSLCERTRPALLSRKPPGDVGVAGTGGAGAFGRAGAQAAIVIEPKKTPQIRRKY